MIFIDELPWLDNAKSGILEELELCGFISINAHFDNQKKNKLYQLVDFYSLFYLNFVKNKRGTDLVYWSSLMDNSVRKAWSGYSFELLCQTHVSQIKKALGISGVLSYVASWRSKTAEDGAQVDLLIDRKTTLSTFAR